MFVRKEAVVAVACDWRASGKQSSQTPSGILNSTNMFRVLATTSKVSRGSLVALTARRAASPVVRLRWNSNTAPSTEERILTPEEIAKKERRAALDLKDDLQRDWDAKEISYAELKPKTRRPDVVRPLRNSSLFWLSNSPGCLPNRRPRARRSAARDDTIRSEPTLVHICQVDPIEAGRVQGAVWVLVADEESGSHVLL